MNQLTAPEDLQQLKAAVTKVEPFTDEAWHDFSMIWKPLELGRKQIITHTGEKEPWLYFIIDGVQRVYYLNEQDREATLVFTYKGSFGGVLDSFLLQQPAQYAYETLTRSTLIRAGHSEIDECIRRHTCIQRFIHKALSFTIAGLLERMAELQCFTSEEKFRKLLQRSPHILQLVPHKYLANYLGIDPTNFSKLLNTVRI